MRQSLTLPDFDLLVWNTGTEPRGCFGSLGTTLRACAGQMTNVNKRENANFLRSTHLWQTFNTLSHAWQSLTSPFCHHHPYYFNNPRARPLTARARRNATITHPILGPRQNHAPEYSISRVPPPRNLSRLSKKPKSVASGAH